MKPARRVPLSLIERELGTLADHQAAALALLDTLEAAGRPVEPALRLCMAAAHDAARRLAKIVDP